MEDCFNYDSVPLNYLHCLNPDCERSESCLRHLVTLHVPQSVKSIVTVNPANYPMDAGQCPYIPYKKALLLKGMIRTLFPKPTYYRILHKERGLSPAEQAEIAGLFAQACITETPAFDSYTEEYDWDGYHVPKAVNSL